MDIGYLNQVKAILKSLVLSLPDRITIDKLNRDFRDVEGEDIPFRKLGYRNLEHFLRQIPDTLLVSGSGHSAVVYFVGNEKSAHIHNMIMGQKKTRPRSRGKSKSSFCLPPQNQPRHFNRGRNNNSFTPASQAPRRMSGQQFSGFEITNRNVSTKTVTVRDIPSQSRPQPTNGNVQAFNTTCTNKSIFDALPQPNGIKKQIPNDSNLRLTNITTVTEADKQPTRQNEMKKSDEANKCSSEINKKYQEHIKQLESLMSTSCHVTSPTAVRTVSFSPETKNELKITAPKSCVSANALAGINAPKPKVKLSEEVERLLKGPSQVKKCNPLEVDKMGEKVEARSTKQTTTNENKSVNNFKKLLDITEDDIDDIDEAVPEFAANRYVFGVDMPKYTVPYGRKIESVEIPDDIIVGSCIRVFITEIHNPFKFWFHIHKDEHELDRLMHQMERYYTTMAPSELHIPVKCLNPGHICAATFNGMWHRGEIVSPPVNNKVKVSFVDYGTVADVNISDIKYLGLCFSQLPAQALRGCLSHIKPRGLHWNHEATSYFLSSVSELMLYAKITEIDRENSAFYMVLCDTHRDEVVQINKHLVEKNYALYNEDWKQYKIIKNNGRRVHHPREDFPTFSMIESGEYPSFAELVQLQERGIDYEIIYDRIIFNKCAILNTYDNVPESIRQLPFFLLTSNPFRADIILELTGMKSST